MLLVRPYPKEAKRLRASLSAHIGGGRRGRRGIRAVAEKGDQRWERAGLDTSLSRADVGLQILAIGSVANELTASAVGAILPDEL